MAKGSALDNRNYMFNSKRVNARRRTESTAFSMTYAKRRSHDLTYYQYPEKITTKSVWKCRTATNRGKDLCKHSKALEEVIIENAFLEAYRLLAVNFDNMLNSVFATVEGTLAYAEDAGRLKKIEKTLSSWESKR